MTVQINGTSGITTPGITTDTSVANTSSTLTGESLTRIKTYTAQNSTSGTQVEFLSIPSWAKRITISLVAVSTNGTTNPYFQLGSTTYTTSGYIGSTSGIGTAVSTSNLSNGFTIGGAGAANTRSGVYTLISNSTGFWCINGAVGFSDFPGIGITAGFVQLSGTLDRLRLYAGGTDIFDAGSVNILVEG